MPTLFILLPPSEGKSPLGGRTTFVRSAPTLAPDTAAVVTQLQALTPAEQLAWYGVSTPEKAAAAHALNLAALTAPARPAMQRYTGVVYDHIGFDTLTAPKADAKRLLIVSALFGLIPATTAIPDYKLPLRAGLATPWRPINTARLAQWTKKNPVLSLLPQTHARAVAIPHAFHVDFRLDGGGKLAGHFGKAIKGRFVRWLLENEVHSPKDFGAFKEDGYVWEQQHPNAGVFTKA
jgi:cytoplasmic iron level regulating protein YaaA (DUF328/UPF0246 family)